MWSLFCSYCIMTSYCASITEQTTAKCYLFVNSKLTAKCISILLLDLDFCSRTDWLVLSLAFFASTVTLPCTSPVEFSSFGWRLRGGNFGDVTSGSVSFF